MRERREERERGQRERETNRKEKFAVPGIRLLLYVLVQLEGLELVGSVDTI